MSKRSLRALGAPLFLVIVGCATRAAEHTESNAEPINLPECEAYAQAHDACMARLGRGAAATVEAERAKAIREELRAPVRDEAEREARRRTCADGAQQLALSCR